MLAPANIQMTASNNPHSIANQGRIEIPGPDTLLDQIQHNYLVKGFQGCSGCGLSGILEDVVGGFSVQTLLLLGAAGLIGYYVLFSSPSAQVRKTKRGEKKLSSEYKRHMDAVKGIQKRYGVKYKATEREV